MDVRSKFSQNDTCFLRSKLIENLHQKRGQKRPQNLTLDDLPGYQDIKKPPPIMAGAYCLLCRH